MKKFFTAIAFAVSLLTFTSFASAEVRPCEENQRGNFSAYSDCYARNNQRVPQSRSQFERAERQWRQDSYGGDDRLYQYRDRRGTDRNYGYRYHSGNDYRYVQPRQQFRQRHSNNDFGIGAIIGLGIAGAFIDQQRCYPAQQEVRDARTGQTLYWRQVQICQ